MRTSLDHERVADGSTRSTVWLTSKEIGEKIEDRSIRRSALFH